jgi:hypothetical protein
MAALDKKDPNYAIKLKALQDRIAENDEIIKEHNDYISGGEIGGDNYLSKLLDLNRNLSTTNFKSYNDAKTDNRWVEKGHFNVFKSGGVLDSSSKDSKQKTMEEIAKLYKDIIKRI